jgi:hypothetical protein
MFMSININMADYAGYNHNAYPRCIHFSLGNYNKITLINVTKVGPYNNGYNIGNLTSGISTYQVKIVYYNGSTYSIHDLLTNDLNGSTVTYGDLLGTGTSTVTGTTTSYRISITPVTGTMVTFTPVLYDGSKYYTIIGAEIMSKRVPITLTTSVNISFHITQTANSYINDLAEYKYTVVITNGTSSSVTYTAGTNYITDGTNTYKINSGNAITVAAGNTVTYNGSCGMSAGDKTFTLYIGGNS